MGGCYWKDREMFCILEIPHGTSRLNVIDSSIFGSGVFTRETSNNGGLKSLVVC